MADRTVQCTLITPEAKVFEEPITSALMTLHDGQTGILNRRAPLMAKLGLGPLRLTFVEGGDRSYLVEGGFVQMVDNRLTLLAESAIPAERISESEAQAELAEAEARQPQTREEMERITRERRRARIKLDMARAFKSAGGGI